MSFTEQQVEWIVTEVLRRLGADGDGKTSTTAAGGSELRLDDQVVTLQSIVGRLSSVTRLVVRPRAIVTPAGQDELKQRKEEPVGAAKKGCPPRGTGGTRKGSDPSTPNPVIPA